jgi:hypothetical protein
MSLPRLLRGAAAIGEHIGASAGSVMHQHRQGSLPTFSVGGTPYATPGALDEWRALYRAGKLPRP